MKIDSNEINEVKAHLTRLNVLGHMRFRAMCEWNANNFQITHNDSQGNAGSLEGVEVRKFYEEQLAREIKKEIDELATFGVTVED